MAVTNIYHMKCGGQFNSCINLNVKMIIFAFCQGKVIHSK